MMKKGNNIAFIDAQNLLMGTREENWEVDHKRFRIYLRDKYRINRAYYFLGCLETRLNPLYTKLQEAGFILQFRDHLPLMTGRKKGNVDSDIVFSMMQKLIDEGEEFDRMVLVSGDGDYKKVVDYMIQKERFIKILFPNRIFASSLYKQLSTCFYDHLNQKDIRIKIEYKKRIK